MAKALKVVGTVVAAVAIVATAAATFGTSLGLSAAAVATASSVATYTGLAAATIGVVSSLAFKPKFSSSGSATRFTTNPQSGLPYAIGRTRMSGLRVHADTNDGFSGKTKNDLLWFAVLLSAGGQIDSIEKFTADGAPFTFATDGNATGHYQNFMAQKVWTGGAMSSALALSLGSASMPGWTTAHKLSGMTHALWALRIDTKGDRYGAGVPEPAWIGKWARVYDPRLDSTYPGGSGSCRALDETTYVWTRNPALHALTWALGRWQNGKKVLGIGAPTSCIRLADFVEAANVADTNAWNCGGVVWSNDSKWSVFKQMLQAGGAVPTMTGAMIGCRVYTPRVSAVTITRDHLHDSLSLPATKSQRDRINTLIPRYRSEDHEWEIVSGTPISVSAYVTEDGRVRQREYDLPLVQHEVSQAGVDGQAQAGQLTAYEIVNAREAGPIRFTTGPQFIGLKAGDCVTLDVPEEGLSAQKVMLTEPPQFDPATGKIQFVAETETDSKHAFALGESTTPPPSFSLTAPDLTPTAPQSGDWTLVAATGADGLPLLRISGVLSEGAFWDSLAVQYRKTGAPSWVYAGNWSTASAMTIEIPGLDGATEYEARIAWIGTTDTGAWLTFSPVTTAASILQAAADAYALALARGKVTVGGAVPSAAASNVGDTHIGDDGTFYERIDGDAGILLGGYAVVLAGYRPRIVWTPWANQPLRDTIAQADAAWSSANDAIDQLIGLANDGLLSKNEKITKLIPENARLEAKWTALSSLAASLGVSTAAASSARTAWNSYLAGLSPAWNDVKQDTSVTRGSYDSARDTYDAALYDLDQAVKNKASTIASWAGVTGTGKPADNATVGAPAGTNVGSTSAATVESGANAANNGVNSDGTIKNNKVATAAVQANNITAPATFTGSDTFLATGSETTIMETTVVSISAGGVAGSANIVFHGTMDATTYYDACLELKLYVDTGSGYVLQATQKAGSKVTSGNNYFYLPLSVAEAVSGQTVKVKITGQPIAIGGYTTNSYVRSPKINIFGGYR